MWSRFFRFKDECSFVSLRDVERAMQVMVWFYNHVDTLGRLMNKVLTEQRREEGRDDDEDDDDDVSNYAFQSFRTTLENNVHHRKCMQWVSTPSARIRFVDIGPRHAPGPLTLGRKKEANIQPHLGRPTSQSQRRIWFIWTAWGASHVIMSCYYCMATFYFIFQTVFTLFVQ